MHGLTNWLIVHKCSWCPILWSLHQNDGVPFSLQRGQKRSQWSQKDWIQIKHLQFLKNKTINYLKFMKNGMISKNFKITNSCNCLEISDFTFWVSQNPQCVWVALKPNHIKNLTPFRMKMQLYNPIHSVTI